MELQTVRDLSEISADSVIVAAYFADERLEPAGADGIRFLSPLDLDGAEARGELKGRLYKSSLFRGSPGVLLVGVGRRADFSDVRWLRAVQAATIFLTRRGFQRLTVIMPSFMNPRVAARAAVEGVVRGVYDDGILKTVEREDFMVSALTLVGEDIQSGELRRAQVVAESANIARRLLNLPPNDLTPRSLAAAVEAIGEESGLSVQVLDEGEIARLGMGAIMAVASGSSQPPRVIDITYGDPTAAVRLTFVGKGLTFDSGGLSLKPAESMEWMKGDMGGSAAVAGAMRAVGLLQPEGVFVRGLIGATENMPGPAAMKPGDVVRTMNGKTVEVLNTDAEGRLVLADVLAYAVELGATHIVDLATLTGAAVVALGNEAAALVGRPQRWVDQVQRAAGRALERLWQLPLYPEYRRQIVSDIADMKNIGGRAGGALTAAALLAEFTGDIPWAHLDIAGTAWVEKRGDHTVAGGTGYGVATLVELAFDLARGGS